MDGCPNLGNDVDNYLCQSLQMMDLVVTGGGQGSTDRYSQVAFRNDRESPHALLLFSEKTTLCGYSIGLPNEVSDGVWRLEVTLCDYDFTSLYERQAQAFAAAEPFPCLTPEQAETCGATWFIQGYNSRVYREDTRTQQLYFLWSQLTSPYAERCYRDIDRYAQRGPKGDAAEPRWCHYLFLNADGEVIGYTMLTTAAE